MTLRRRLLLFLIGGAVLAWSAALVISVQRARHEVNELFDTELIRLARQVQSILGEHDLAMGWPPRTRAPAEDRTNGEADMDDLAIAVWDAQGRLRFTDREGAALPHRRDAAGFVDLQLGGEEWRVYYLQSFTGDWLVASGQKAYERDEMVYGLTWSQLQPWLLVLPVLVAAIALAVQRALVPMQRLVKDLGSRGAHDLKPIDTQDKPADLLLMVDAVNGLFGRIESAMARERAFTAYAAHELRTPLAVLRAQWDVLRHSAPGAPRSQAEAKLGAGLERMDRLVTQMLALSRLEAGSLVLHEAPVDWQALVEQVVSDCLPLAGARRIELACEWPPVPTAPMPLRGDSYLLAVMLRNLLDNAMRYAPVGSPVFLRIGSDRIEVENAGAPLTAEQLARLGERFYRPDGQDETGSGLGISIVKRVAALHALDVTFSARDSGDGMRVTLRATGVPAETPAAADSAPAAWRPAA